MPHKPHNKVITIWGSPSSGKTLLSLMLARQLSHHGSCLILNMSNVVPILPILLPYEDIDKNGSLGMAMKYLGDTPADSQSFQQLSKYIHLHPDSDNIAVMGMASGDNPVAYPTPTKQTIYDLLKLLSDSPFDYIIYDGSAATYIEQGTFWALRLAEYKICTITADVTGLEWYRSQALWLKDTDNGVFNTIKDIRLITNFDSLSEAEIVSENIGGIEYFLPFAKDLKSFFKGGKLPKGAYDKNTAQYISIVRKIADSIIKGD